MERKPCLSRLHHRVPRAIWQANHSASCASPRIATAMCAAAGRKTDSWLIGGGSSCAQQGFPAGVRPAPPPPHCDCCTRFWSTQSPFPPGKRTPRKKGWQCCIGARTLAGRAAAVRADCCRRSALAVRWCRLGPWALNRSASPAAPHPHFLGGVAYVEPGRLRADAPVWIGGCEPTLQRLSFGPWPGRKVLVQLRANITECDELHLTAGAPGLARVPNTPGQGVAAVDRAVLARPPQLTDWPRSAPPHGARPEVSFREPDRVRNGCAQWPGNHAKELQSVPSPPQSPGRASGSFSARAPPPPRLLERCLAASLGSLPWQNGPRLRLRQRQAGAACT